MDTIDFQNSVDVLYDADGMAQAARDIAIIAKGPGAQPLDIRLVQRWYSGKFVIPPWVKPIMITLLRQRAQVLSDRAAQARVFADDLELGRGPDVGM